MALHVSRVVYDMPEYALLIHDEGDPSSAHPLLIEDAQGFCRLMARMRGDHGELDAAMLGKGLLDRRPVYAHTPYLGVQLLEVRPEALELPQLSLSTAGERGGIESDHDILLPLVVGEVESSPIRPGKADFRRMLSDVRHDALLLGCFTLFRPLRRRPHYSLVLSLPCQHADDQRDEEPAEKAIAGCFEAAALDGMG